MPKSTAAEKEKRINEIYGLLLNGKNHYDIVHYAASAWAVKKRQVDNYIAEAHALIASEAEYHRASQIGKAIARLNLVFGKAITDSDWTAAINAQRELNKLLSLYEPEAPKTLQIMGMDEAELQTVGIAMQKAGFKPSEAFEAMLNIIAEEAKVKRQNEQ